MLSARHQTLIDDLCCIVTTSIDMHAFFHDRVRACSKRLSGLIATWLDLCSLRSHVVEESMFGGDEVWQVRLESALFANRNIE